MKQDKTYFGLKIEAWGLIIIAIIIIIGIIFLVNDINVDVNDVCESMGYVRSGG